MGTLVCCEFPEAIPACFLALPLPALLSVCLGGTWPSAVAKDVTEEVAKLWMMGCDLLFVVK